MDIGSALVIVLGLVFLVSGGLYVAARSYSEKLGDPQPRWWRVVRTTAAIVWVSVAVYMGTLVLVHGVPNYFFGAGVATFCYFHAFTVVSGRAFEPSVFRIRCVVFAVQFSLFAIGAVLEGGSIGILFAILSTIVSTFWWWLVAKVPWNLR